MSSINGPAALMDLCCKHVPLWECGALGPDNAYRLAAAALRHGHPALAVAGGMLARFAWEADPLDPRLVRLVAAMDEDGSLPGPAGPLVRDLAARCRVPADHAVLHGVHDAATLLDLLRPRLADPAHGAFWLGRGVALCLAGTGRPLHGSGSATMPCDAGADFALLNALLDAFPRCHPLLALRLRAGFAALHLPTSEAHALLAPLREGSEPSAHPVAPAGSPGVKLQTPSASPQGGLAPESHRTAFSRWATIRTAALHAAAGDTAEAAVLIRPLWEAMPWHPNLTLALYELERPQAPPPTDTAPPAILLYSWNKCDVLAETLASLRTSGTGKAPVFVLDNGSTDGTDAMLTHAEADWGTPFTRLRLPVNIGAPAARNWLLSLDAVRAHERVVFLDDDVVLDHGWLNGLLSIAEHHPAAAVVGCRITDSTPPHAVQCADFFALPPELGQRSFADLDEQVFIHGNAGGSTDTLLTAYARPCLSVSGCCHLLDRGALDACGHFDIRFTPSQFDDLEHDLRTVLSGREVWYTGNVRVRHVQHSSLRQATDPAKNAHIFGNRIKLEHLYPAPRMREARETSALAARRDLLRKATRLAGTGRRT